ncbi:peptidoglycan DD-metalloendopeptidase family protein [Roseospira marina]|uniref:Peptidoglycan DD-metalloendopeptidase family protein n=1 Tax=Roseospira marina TaxID=140057 RepID=A0A5M6IFN7_9PROT|nr:peptidoglycan DD-metalloendopeptidase family protein [Roseospira marina]KAA5607110.1 peptidoglycan DD-metalloendopeptidase family protein [Roseospira marina]MBB4312694.1 murein DD-endopeptidase MepM/ murein hydrolase activator NlpD [Roseospira marina]MBB5086533.1 murein DD-endopeptidase MepM/ murein hydrolase activator NlpD [Roseospira marina]
MSEYDPQQLSLPPWKRALRRAFPERYLMIRADNGGYHAWTLGSLTQAFAAAGGVVLLGIVTYSLAMVIWVDAVIDAKTAEVNEARDSYKQLLAEVALYRDQVAEVTRSLENNHAVISRYVDSDSSIATQETPATEDTAQGSTPETWEIEAGRARDALLAQLSEMEQGMAELSEAHQLLTRFDDFELEMRKMVLQRDLALEENKALTNRVGSLEDLVVEMEASQAALLDHFGTIAQTRISDIEDSLSEVGLDVDSLLNARPVDGDGQGGPFIPVDMPLLDKPVLKASVATLNTHVDRLGALRDLTDHLPLTRPILSGYRLSSPFGVRRDPINGRLSRHEGLDFAAGAGTPIVAPAAGKVVYAGRRGGYGRTLEISHGMGLLTRYGHLSSIALKVGDSVKRGDVIATVGNSGRSTGSHLHYEIRVNGVPRNPAKFMKAGQHVFKG